MSNREDYYKSLHYNTAADGYNYYRTSVVRNGYPLMSFGNYQNIFNQYHNVSNVPHYAGNKAPIFGSGGARWENDTNNMPYNLGYNLLYNGDEDNDYTGGSTLPFDFYMGGSPYNQIYTGTNTYFTFGDGSDEYNDLSANNPNIPKIFLGSEDHSYQRVWDKVATEYYRVRYEGTDDTSGSEGDPNIVIEATFYNPVIFNGRMVCEILVGQHAASDEINMIASANKQLCFNPPSLEPNKSYVMIGDSMGEYWTVKKGFYLQNPKYAI